MSYLENFINILQSYCRYETAQAVFCLLGRIDPLLGLFCFCVIIYLLPVSPPCAGNIYAWDSLLLSLPNIIALIWGIFARRSLICLNPAKQSRTLGTVLFYYSCGLFFYRFGAINKKHLPGVFGWV